MNSESNNNPADRQPGDRELAGRDLPGCDDELQQQLWELVYDLLPESEADAVRRRITSEPEVARAYAEVQLHVELLATAARLDEEPIDLSQAGHSAAGSVGVAAHDRAANSARGISPLTASLNTVLTVATLLVAALVGYQYLRSDSPLNGERITAQHRELADAYTRTVITGPVRWRTDEDNEVQVTTTSADGRPQSRSLRYWYDDGLGKTTAARVETNQQGEGRFVLPASSVKPNGRLQIETGDRTRPLITRLQVEEPQFATYVSVDRPLYQPGEVVNYRSLTLSRYDFQDTEDTVVQLYVVDPDGKELPDSRHAGLTKRGVGNGAYVLPPSASSGIYAVIAQHDQALFPDARREFQVRRYRRSGWQTELEFARDRYVAGDEVIADFSVQRADGRAVAGASIELEARLDGDSLELANAAAAPRRTSPQGTFQVKFTLPDTIQRGDGWLTVRVAKGNQQEAITRPIPLQSDRVDVAFFPEGGDLVGGLPSRVYLAATDPRGEPVALSGRVLDQQNREVGRVTTQHAGRGSFELTPSRTASYRLVVDSPAGVSQSVPLPKPNPDRFFVLRAAAAEYAEKDPLKFLVGSVRADVPLVMTAVCRGVTVGHRQLTTRRWVEPHVVEIPVADAADGVVRVTAYDYSQPTPLAIAERLVFRRSARQLQVALDAKQEVTPGERVKVNLRVHNEQGNPQPAVVGVSVVDSALLDLAGDKSPRLATYFRLTGDVDRPESLEDANFFLSPAESAPRALDLLLATQGWRSFRPSRSAGDSNAKEVADDTATDLVAQTLDLQKDVPKLGQQLAIRSKMAQRGRTLTDDAKTLDGAQRPPVETPTPPTPTTPTRATPTTAATATTTTTLSAAVSARSRATSVTRGAPLRFDNQATVARMYLSEAVQLQQRDGARLNRVGWSIVLAGACLFVVVVLMSFLRLCVSRVSWLAVGVSVASIAIGICWAGARYDSQDQLVVGPVVRPPSHPVALARRFESTNMNHSWGLAATGGVPDTVAFLATAPERVDSWSSRRRTVSGLALHAVSEELEQEELLTERSLESFGVEPNQFSYFLGFGRSDRELGISRSWARPSVGWNTRFERERLGRLYMLNQVDASQLARFRREELAQGPAYRDVVRRYVELQSEAQQAAQRRAQVKLRSVMKEIAKVKSQARFQVRVYAHQSPARKVGQRRRDDTRMLYWNPLLIADGNGEASLEFSTSDLVTSYRVQADAHGNGRIGSGGGEFTARVPFSVEPKLPHEVTAGDRITAPVVVKNDSDVPLDVKVDFPVDKLFRLADARPVVPVEAKQRKQVYVDIDAVGARGRGAVAVAGVARQLTDATLAAVEVTQAGYPVNRSYGGQLDGRQEVSIAVPGRIVPDSLDVRLRAFPTLLADLQRSAEGLGGEPVGCFEQVTSATYPHIEALRFMHRHGIAAPQVTRQAKRRIQDGQARRKEFESPTLGYEWFGGDPGNEALTAYGLMQSRELATVWNVDPNPVRRNTDWLFKRRDASGGFVAHPNTLDRFGKPSGRIVSAYVVWALSEAAQTGGQWSRIERDVNRAVQSALAEPDAYVVALAAGAVLNRKVADKSANRDELRDRTAPDLDDAPAPDDGPAAAPPIDDRVTQLLDSLLASQQDDGHLEGADTITRSGGLARRVETTALAALAWFKVKSESRYQAAAQRAVDWLLRNRRVSGTFGSTQATALAIKALAADARQHRRKLKDGHLILRSGDKELARTGFVASQLQPITVSGVAQHLKPGENRWVVELTGDNKLPFALEVNYRTLDPPNHPNCPLVLEAKLAAKRVKVGDHVAVRLRLDNKTAQPQPMSVAVVGLPAGLSVHRDQLEQLTDQGLCDSFESRGRELVFYWRSLAPSSEPESRRELSLDLHAEVPGRYTGPASRAYLYYTDEQKQWSEPLAIEITK